MSTMGSMGSFAVTPSNYTNGALASYTFSFVLSIPTAAGDKLYITFPTETTLFSNSSCTAVTLISSISCSVSGHNLIATLSSVYYIISF